MNARIMMTVHPERVCGSCFAHDAAAGCLAGYGVRTTACSEHRSIQEDRQNVLQPHVAPAALATDNVAGTGHVFEHMSDARCTDTPAANEPMAHAVRRRGGVDVGAPPPTKEVSRDHQLARSFIGPAITAARELNGLSQTQAAKLLGYEDPTQLSLFEKGHRIPPLYQLQRIAEVLSVSLDWLFGISQDPERNPGMARRNACVRATRAHMQAIAENIADLIDGADNLAGPNAQHFRELNNAAREAADAASRFHYLNAAAFDDMRGGATLLAATERLEAMTMKSTRTLELHDSSAKAMADRLAAIGADKDDAQVV